MSSAPTLARRTLGTGALMVFGVVASSPLTVASGGIPATYAGTGVAGVPISFLLIMAVLGVLAVGYLQVSRYVVHPAPFFALAARGLDGRAGVAAAGVMLVGYNCIQISLYGFLGARMAGLVGGVWWVWAAAWALVALFGIARMTTNAVLLGGLLLVELSVVVLVVVAAVAHPAADQGPVVGVWEWRSLLTPAGGGALALAMAAFVGAECAPVYGEEARSPRSVVVATLAVFGLLGASYAVLAWAVRVGVGMPALLAGGDPTALVFEVIRRGYGYGVVVLATMLLVTSVMAAMVSFHHVVARQVFGLARDGVLPRRLAGLSTGPAGGTPRAGSVVQSVLAAGIVVGFVGAGADPIDLFTWLSTVGALCVLSLLVVSSAAAFGFYRAGGGRNETVLMRAVAPIVGALLGGLVVVFMVGNLRSLLGLPPGSLLVWLPLAVAAGAAGVGWVWGAWIRRYRLHTYARLGRGPAAPVAVLDQRLAALEV